MVDDEWILSNIGFRIAGAGQLKARAKVCAGWSQEEIVQVRGAKRTDVIIDV